jgi:hypothetical protein
LTAALANTFHLALGLRCRAAGALGSPAPRIAAIALERIREEPLLSWTDVPGSKLRPAAALRSGLDLLRIGVKLRLF